MRMKLSLVLLALGALWLAFPAVAGASGAEAGGAGHGLEAGVLVGVAVMLLVAKLGGEVFERVGQPAVLGELIGGMLVGALGLVLAGATHGEPHGEPHGIYGVARSSALAGVALVELLRTNAVVAALAEIGVIILLFEVGLESNLGEMMEVGWSSLLVAVAGVVAPFFLGWGVAAYFIPDEPTLGHIFIGATLCATSVGITARVLKDLGKIQTRESRIVLGAAVIDDVLGLLILAVVAGAIRASAAGASLSVADVGIIALKALVFLGGALAVGHFLVPHVFRGAGRLETRGVLLALSLAFCFTLAWLAALVGLAPIVGAFAAGLVLDEVHFQPFTRRGERDLDDLLAPVAAVLVPVFFVLMGLRVDLRAFARPELLGFAAVLTVVAIIGKQVCSLAVLERGVNRLAVGVGMIPRGEVGLIFAGIGATLMLPNAAGQSEPVVNSATFGAVVIMVIVTTLVTPPVLKWALSRGGGDSPAPAPEPLRDTADGAAEHTRR